jgi:hypothetical protein
MMSSTFDFLQVCVKLGLCDGILVGGFRLQLLVLFEHVYILPKLIHKPSRPMLNNIISRNQNIQSFLRLS